MPVPSSSSPVGETPTPGGALRRVQINVGTALVSLARNWFRSALTMLGVVIGVAAVIVLMAFGEGAQHEITTQIDTLGSNVAVIVPGKMQGEKNFNPLAGMSMSVLSPRDRAALRQVPGVRDAAPLVFLGGGVSYGKKPASLCIPLAVPAGFDRVRRLTFSAGRFFGPEEEDDPVCVIGTGLKEDLFGDANATGEKLMVNGRMVRVIGVVAARTVGSGVFGGDELDAVAYVPLRGVEKTLGGAGYHRIFVDLAPGADPDRTAESMRRALLRVHNQRDDFSILRAKELLAMFYKIFNLLAALLLGITGISLVVGGIGIMNIMLVTVTERTHEIGIRKTVGARRLDIFCQFLTEAVALSAIGGAIGIGVAIAVCRMVPLWLPLRPLVSAHAVGLGFTVCVVVGVLSGVAPAVAAARKDPIEAIRFE